jgi:hypothetical protein
MQVWSFTATDEKSGQCTCSERPGTAVPGVVGAKSGRLRDATAVLPADADAPTPNFSRYGGDYDTYGASAEDCRKDCADAALGPVPKCLGWASVTNPDNGFVRCYLKGDGAAMPVRYAANSALSGASNAGALIELTLPNQVHDNWDHMGGDLPSVANPVAGWDVCNDLCAADIRCLAWAFSKDRNACFLKREVLLPGGPNSGTLFALNTGLTVVVSHAYADGQVDSVVLRTGLSSFFDGALTIVRDATQRTYQLYVDGTAVGSAQKYEHDPLAMPAVMRVAQSHDGVPVSDYNAPVSELSFFDRALDAEGVKALLAPAAPLTAP